MRATSSIRSTSRVTSSRRSAGTVTSSPSARRLRSRSRARSGSRPGARARRRRRGSPARAPRAGAIAGARARRRQADVDRARARRVAPHSSIISRARDRLRVHALLRLQPLLEARRGLAAQAERPRGCGGCWVRSRWRPPAARAWCPARPPSARRPSARRSTSGPSASSITTISRSSVRVWPSSVCTCSPSCGAAHRQSRARDAVEVEGVQRLAGEQHRVVGDVDDVVDRRAVRRR